MPTVAQVFDFFLGGNIAAYVRTVTDDPGVNPGPDATPTFDPMFGFPKGRKERVMIATKEEMDAANLEDWQRDYCAHTAIEVEKCRMRNRPLTYRCKHEYHAHLGCQYDDFIIRAKEFERERRLRMRQQRIEKKKAEEELGA